MNTPCTRWAREIRRPNVKIENCFLNQSCNTFSIFLCQFYSMKKENTTTPGKNRFDIKDCRATMKAVVTTGNGGYEKLEKVQAIGADQVIARDEDIVDCLGEKSVDVVVDNVAGHCFGGMLKVLKRGGRFVSSGAIAGPLVELDMRDFYLKDLTLIGCTA